MNSKCRIQVTDLVLLILCLILQCGCAASQKITDEHKPIPVPLTPAIAQEPAAFVSVSTSGTSTLIRSATILTADDQIPRIDNGWIRIEGGRILAMGTHPPPSPTDNERVIDAKGRYVTPGLIDTHSHLGVYPSPHVWAHADGNEMTNPITAGVRAEEAFWPQDPGIQRAVAGGVTTIQVLPGSGNLMGGRGVVLKLHPRIEARAMRFPGASDALKMACGENPKRVYGKGRKSLPMSRMGNIFVMRKTWIAARRYKQKWDEWEKNKTKLLDGEETPVLPPKRDLSMETLARVLEGKINVHIHCYRADEMLLQLKLAKEFGYRVRSFHHAVEAYKIRDVLAKEGVAVSTWADWWGFKIEAYDAIEENLALLGEAGARAILHTDSAEGIQRMNQEAAKGYFAGRHAGIKISEHDALKWITANPAWALGVDGSVGSLKVGKSADLVLWNRHPFSVYASTDMVFIDGDIRYQKGGNSPVWSDFEVGQ
jgi:imidazolonepropionase-like amidohydrolase